VVKKSRYEECYLVEGFFDVISLTEKGIENCIAMLGTNLSEEQLKLLIELKKRIILFLDSDSAGQEASINTAVKLLIKEIDCEIVKCDYQGDPDEICRQDNKELLLDIIQKRENPYLFILEYYFIKLEIKENPQRVSRFISEIAKIFQKFKINIRNFLIEKISLLVK
jgi:DNA primase